MARSLPGGKVAITGPAPSGRRGKLDARKVYSEAEINDFLKPFHLDICMLRRELIVNKLMVRSGGRYKVVGWNR